MPLGISQMTDPRESSFSLLKVMKRPSLFFFTRFIFLLVVQVYQYNAGIDAQQCPYFKNHSSQLPYSESAVHFHSIPKNMW